MSPRTDFDFGVYHVEDYPLTVRIYRVVDSHGQSHGPVCGTRAEALQLGQELADHDRVLAKRGEPASQRLDPSFCRHTPVWCHDGTRRYRACPTCGVTVVT